MDDLLSHLLRSDPTPLDPALSAWWERAAPLRDRFGDTVERALVLGLVAPSVGAAFVGGYRAALHRLVPALGPHTRAALCASEARGAHPRHIETRAVSSHGVITLDGTKRFVTGARAADLLLVLAVTSIDADGTRHFSVLRVAPDAPGVTFEDMPATPFVPDVSHASVTFSKVRVAPDDALHGDGWAHVVKPFRTVEDLHVQAAVTGMLLGALRRHSGPESVIERLSAHALALRALSASTLGAPTSHVALAGAFANLDAIIEALDVWWPSAPAALAEAWTRDRTLLTVARNAREARRAKAWSALRA